MKSLLRSLVGSVCLPLALGGMLAPLVHAAPAPKAFGELPLSFDADLSPDGR